MGNERLWLIALTLSLGCESPVEQPSMGSGGTASSSGGSGGSAPSSAGAMSAASGGSAGGTASGGATIGGSSGSDGGGGSSSGGGGGNGASTSGGAGGGQGVGGTAGTASASGGGGNGGGGGSTGCVKNLACKLSAPPSTGDIYQDCVNRINQFLTECACLPPLERRLDGESCADQMAEYDASKNTPHAGARDKICQPGGSQNECPGYASNNQVISLCLQQMWDEGPPPTDPCTGTCYETHGHYLNMTDPSVTKVACGFHTTPSGEVWAVQNFSN